MLTIRVIMAGALWGITVAAAAAQTGDAPGKPVSLLQMLTQPSTTTTTTTTTVTTTATVKHHARFARPHAVRRLAKKSHEHEDAEQTEQAQTEQRQAEQTPVEQTPAEQSAPDAAAPPAPSVWPTGGAAPLPGVAADATAPTVIPTVDQNLSAVVVGGHTVQIATPEAFNPIDLAADHQPQADAPAAPAAAAPAVALAEPDDQARDTWYEELLATLGGALAAAVVAWFLVTGGSQQRMYG